MRKNSRSVKPPQLSSLPPTDEAFLENEKKTITISVQLHNLNNALEVDNIIQLSSCQPHCIATLTRKNICTDMKKVVEYDVKLTFWLYLLVRVFFGMIGGTAFAMFEGAVIAILREQNGDYGMQRIYATMGGMISSPLSGLLIDYASRGNGYTDIRRDYTSPTIQNELIEICGNIIEEKKVENINASRPFAILADETSDVSTAWGYIESFLFWLLQDLGASGSLMGITITVAGIAGIPLLVLSGPIIDRIGHANVLFIGFIFYAIRLLGYSIIYNPWLCLIFEAMESVTSSLSFTAAVTYAAKLSSTTTDTSIQGLLGGIYFGVGKM
uniref:Major facilitator superfamily associated domain-containing protein n=1 Tax=Timema bartmani TaxID=61472 RepID=A0A7R9I5G9_9NEOP|nr:unnamed protein product [Timema bartmani]